CGLAPQCAGVPRGPRRLRLVRVQGDSAATRLLDRAMPDNGCVDGWQSGHRPVPADGVARQSGRHVCERQERLSALVGRDAIASRRARRGCPGFRGTAEPGRLLLRRRGSCGCLLPCIGLPVRCPWGGAGSVRRRTWRRTVRPHLPIGRTVEVGGLLPEPGCGIGRRLGYRRSFLPGIGGCHGLVEQGKEGAGALVVGAVGCAGQEAIRRADLGVSREMKVADVHCRPAP
ncbi:MAG: hypothetical protein KAX19_12640, partial [Candidatus Brocadiae bacterium]|nr:hypothetical protein [Candidatus Brocadiia bacterium]